MIDSMHPVMLDAIYQWANDKDGAGYLKFAVIQHGKDEFLHVKQDGRETYFALDGDIMGERYDKIPDEVCRVPACVISAGKQCSCGRRGSDAPLEKFKAVYPTAIHSDLAALPSFPTGGVGWPE